MDFFMMMNGMQGMKQTRKRAHLFLVLFMVICISGCGGHVIMSPGVPTKLSESKAARMGYSVQIGAFSNLDNAIRLTKSLENKGLRAYYFVHKSGLYKVRFGDFPTREAARKNADLTCLEFFSRFPAFENASLAAIKPNMSQREACFMSLV